MTGLILAILLSMSSGQVLESRIDKVPIGPGQQIIDIDLDGNPDTEDYFIEGYTLFPPMYRLATKRNGQYCIGPWEPFLREEWRFLNRFEFLWWRLDTVRPITRLVVESELSRYKIRLNPPSCP